MSGWDQAPVVKAGWDAAPSVSASRARANKDAERRASSVPDFVRSLGQGATFGFADELDAKLAGLETRLNPRAGYSPQEAEQAVLEASRQRQKAFEQEHPVQNFAAQVVGGAALPFGQVRNARQAAVAGGAAGGLYGYGAAEGDAAQRTPSGLGGAAIGAIGGSVLQGALSAAAPVARRVSSAIGDTARRVANRATNNRVTPAPQSAARQVLNGQDPAAMMAERSRLQGLGVDPALVDVMNPSGQRLMRAAASAPGPGADQAVQAAVRARVDTKPSIMQATRSLSGETRTAQRLATDLGETQSALANEQYREPYAAPVQLTREAIEALRGEDGRAAIQRAIRGARANQDYGRMAELQELLDADLDQLPTVSGAALDRVRIAMRERATNAGRAGARDVARGLQGRLAGIDTALDTAPGLQEARATYRGLQGQIDVLDDSPDVFSTAPADFTEWVNNLSPEQQQAAIVRARQDILDTLGGQRAATTGSADALATSDYARQNLETLLGPQAAQQYIDTIQARLGQGATRRFISPNDGSQTFLRAQDQGAFDLGEAIGAAGDAVGTIRGRPDAAARLVTRIVSGATMTPAEREQIVQMGLGSADELERIIALAERSTAAGRAPPRQVRDYVTRAAGALGQTHPLVIELQKVAGVPGAYAGQDDPNAPAVTVETVGDMSVADWLRAQEQPR